MPDSGTPDDVDAGTPDAGDDHSGDAGEPDGGTDSGYLTGPGPWPTDALLDYTQTFGIGTPQSVGLDEGLNLWLLADHDIGVLRPGDQAPTWTHGVGQGRQPWGPDSPAMGSTVICGGEAGRAYVGYAANEMKRQEGIEQRTWIPNPGDANFTPERYAEYQKGDLDVVRLNADGKVQLEEHLWRTVGPSNKDRKIGIHNTNDYHYDEDRSILSCARVTRGRDRGTLYVSTNHGVTMIQGLTYNSHRHPGWYFYTPGSVWGSLQCPPMHGLGLAPNGDVLVANEQMVGILQPNGNLVDWDTEQTWDGPVPWKFKGYNPQLNGQGDDDHWRAFEQTTGGRYYLGSAGYGLWQLDVKNRSGADWIKVSGLPTNNVRALKSTDDGALYIGTDGAGLWRMEPDGAMARVAGISGNRVLQLVYEPTVTPSMLLVLTERGLTVLRGP